MTKIEEKELRDKLKKDLLKDVSELIDKEVALQFKSRENEKMVREICSSVLVNFFKTLSNRSSFWSKAL